MKEATVYIHGVEVIGRYPCDLGIGDIEDPETFVASLPSDTRLESSDFASIATGTMPAWMCPIILDIFATEIMEAFAEL
jgi:hypothetical protein